MGYLLAETRHMIHTFLHKETFAQKEGYLEQNRVYNMAKLFIDQETLDILQEDIIDPIIERIEAGIAKQGKGRGAFA